MAQTTFPWASRPRLTPTRVRQPRELPQFLALPLVTIFLKTSPTSLLANLNNPQLVQAISLSLLTTLISLGVIIIMGTPVAYLLARYQSPLETSGS